MTQTQEPLVIHNLQDLQKAIQHSDFSVRCSTLEAIYTNPKRALAYGKNNSKDILDLLIDEYQETRSEQNRLILLQTIGAFQDQRTGNLFKSEFCPSVSTDELLILNQYLMNEPPETLKDVIRPFLMDDSSPYFAQVTADLATKFDDLTLVEQVRVSVLSQLGVPLPEISEATWLAWFALLSGPHILQALLCLETLGEAGRFALLDHWDELSENVQCWLLKWGEDKAIDLALTLGNIKINKAALEAIIAKGTLHPAITEFLKHPAPELRSAALRAGATPKSWSEFLYQETPHVRIAAIHRYAHEQQLQALPELVQLLEDRSWEIRAAATDALIDLGAPVKTDVLPLIRHSRLEVRAAAMRVLGEIAQQI